MITEQYYPELFQQWSSNHYSEEQILNYLESKGVLQDHVEGILKQYKKHRMLQRTNQGFLFIGIGALLGLISCLFTVYGVLPEFRSFILYGLTGMGITIACYGGYLVFE
ncbi:MAG: hypothetical protein JNM95_02235 [Chitinophagaceae bacterium]|nr:hypothetical protein [Chitinophagaceae bacterium]